jgi:putative exosortase-associated protein (TIGR04073 family)
MKKLIPLTVFCLFALLMGTANGWAVQSAAGSVENYRWPDKLKRGVLNIISSPVEIARDIHITTDEKNLLAGWTIGLIKGLGDFVVRLGAGAIDTVTFPFNFPDNHKAPLIEPEYVWQKPGLDYA